jgi:hypothetical protein
MRLRSSRFRRERTRPRKRFRWHGRTGRVGMPSPVMELVSDSVEATFSGDDSDERERDEKRFRWRRTVVVSVVRHQQPELQASFL